MDGDGGSHDDSGVSSSTLSFITVTTACVGRNKYFDAGESSSGLNVNGGSGFIGG
jgi:hypothetical protein